MTLTDHLRRAIPPFLMVSVCATLLACSGEAPDTHPDKVMTKRRAIFKQMTKTLEPIGLAAAGREPFRAPEVLAQAQQLEQLSAQPWPLFTADGNYPPTRAKPEVWSDAQGFGAAKDDYLQKVQQLTAAARTGDAEATKQAFDAVTVSCKACHKKYRNE